MPDSIKNVLSGITNKHDELALRRALESVTNDLTTLAAKHNALLAKLDAEQAGGVATFDTNYAALHSVTLNTTL